MFQFAQSGLGWLIPIFVAISVGFAIWMYRKEVKLSEAPGFLIKIMAVLRGLVIFVLLFLLLQPTYISNKLVYSKPILILAVDNSQSVAMYSDTAQLRQNFLPALIEKIGNLDDKFDIQIFNFDNAVKTGKTDYSGKRTNFGVLFDDLAARFEGRKPGAIILVSDGNNNTGIDPVYGSQLSDVPVFAVGLGDTIQRSDVRISNVQYNQTMLLNTSNELRVNVVSNVLIPKGVKLSLMDGEKILSTKNISLITSRSVETIFEVMPAKNGFWKYTIIIEDLPDEQNLINNTQDIYFNVIDKKKKIVIFAENINPDITAIRQALYSNINLDAVFIPVNEFNGNLADIDLAIFVQMPAKSKNEILTKYLATGKPFVILAGPRTNYAEFNKLNLGMSIEPKQLLNEYSQIYLNTASKGGNAQWMTYNFFSEGPPLVTPLATYKVSNTSDIIFFRKYKTVQTQQPIFLGVQHGNANGLVFIGEGLWQWRLYEAEKNGNTLGFDRFINMWVNTLSAKPIDGRLAIFHSLIFTNTDACEFEAETYDKEMKPVVANAVKIAVKGDQTIYSDFSFVTGNKYKALLKLPGNGVYSYRAVAYFADDSIVVNGQFAVADELIEYRESNPDFAYLRKLSALRNGSFYLPSQTDALLEKLNSTDSFKKSVVEKTDRIELIHWKYLFFVLLLFVSLEWFWRKYYGHI